MQHVINNFLSCKFHFGMLRATSSFISDLFFLQAHYNIQHSAFIDLRHVNFLFSPSDLCGTEKQFVSPLGLKGWMGTTTLKDAYMRVASKHHIRRPLNVRYILFMNKTLVNMVPVSVRM